MFPVLFEWHDFILYSYPIFMGMGWGISYQMLQARIPPEVSRKSVHFLFWGILFFSWVGAKLLFLLTSAERGHGQSLSFWLGGGFVFYGGLLGGASFLLIALRKKKQELFLNALIPALLVGHAVGRIGCFFAGCCFGAETDSFLGVFMHGHWRHPTQLFEALGLLLIYGFMEKWDIRGFKMLSLYLFFYGVLRILIEQLRGDVVRGMWGGMTPGSWISLFFILAGVLLRIKVKKVERF